jgi:hypothetical protein
MAIHPTNKKKQPKPFWSKRRFFVRNGHFNKMSS